MEKKESRKITITKTVGWNLPKLAPVFGQDCGYST
jgi:hypothetical protein